MLAGRQGEGISQLERTQHLTALTQFEMLTRPVRVFRVPYSNLACFSVYMCKISDKIYIPAHGSGLINTR